MTLYQPVNDGIDHVNVYSKSKTELGRFLSNFTYSPVHTEDGFFATIEGYWYWLGTGDERLRLYTKGWECKRLGKSLGVTKIDQSVFKQKILKALDLKLVSRPEKLTQLQMLDLPLTHYYYFGSITNPRIIQVTDCDWILDHFRKYRHD